MQRYNKNTPTGGNVRPYVQMKLTQKVNYEALYNDFIKEVTEDALKAAKMCVRSSALSDDHSIGLLTDAMRNGLLWCALDLGFSDREMNTLEKKYTKHIEDFAESLLDEAYENPISVKEFREADLSSLIGQLMWAKKLISSRL